MGFFYTNLCFKFRNRSFEIVGQILDDGIPLSNCFYRQLFTVGFVNGNIKVILSGSQRSVITGMIIKISQKSVDSTLINLYNKNIYLKWDFIPLCAFKRGVMNWRR